MNSAEKPDESRQAEALIKFYQSIRSARDRSAHRKVVRMIGKRQYRKLRRTALNELEQSALRGEEAES